MEVTQRIVDQEIKEEDENNEARIRPACLEDYIGQQVVKEQMQVFIKAARERCDALDHVLIFGPPGLGKTTLSHIIAHEMGSSLKQTSGPVLDKPGDLAALLTNLQPHDVLFIDEIHRMNPQIEEVLYPAMEDYELDIMIGEGPSARSVKLSLPPFTLVGATTRAGLLTAPLRDRFGIVQRLNFYHENELAKIINRSSGILNMQLEEGAAKVIARRSRGTPRIANRLLRRVRDYAQIDGKGKVSCALAQYALDALHVDQLGLDELDRRFLMAIMGPFDGGPVGIDSIAATVGEERGTLEDIVEPFLIQIGLVMRTPRGRIVSPLASQHLGVSQEEETA